MDYKEKYEQALEKARQLCAYPTTQPFIRDLQDLFPELRESDDERIRKAIIKVFALHKDYEVFFGASVEDIHAWLERQGDLTIRFFTDEFEWALGRIIAFWNQNHKDGKYDENELMSYIKVRETELVKLFADNVCKVSLSDCSEEYRKAYYDGYNKCNRDWLKIKDISVYEYNKSAEILLGGQVEQKPADMVEPKFKVGDWIINNEHNNVAKVLEINNEEYRLDYCDTVGTISIALIDNDYHLWTIQDAKSGDIIYTPKGCGVEGIFLIEGWKKVEDTGRTLCSDIGYRVDDDEIIAGGLGAIWWKGVIDPFYPATKEQRDLLFEKIREKGFEYDSKKKRYIRKKVPKEYSIIIDGVRHNLIKPEIEDCKKCSLDKFCDRFKEALCDALVGRHTGMIFEKEDS